MKANLIDLSDLVLFILCMDSKKCFNAKNFFVITFSHKIQDLGRVSTKKIKIKVMDTEPLWKIP